ncbi:MAG: hypothetical protein ACR2P9_01325 [Gammaproteobacteria bacterium]
MAEAWRQYALDDIAQTLGFKGGLDGQVQNFVVGDRKYLLNIEPAGDEGEELVLVVFHQLLPGQVKEKAVSLLQRCHYTHYHPFLVQVGMDGKDSVALAARIGPESANKTGEAFAFMLKLYAEAGL